MKRRFWIVFAFVIALAFGISGPTLAASPEALGQEAPDAKEDTVYRIVFRRKG